MISDAYVRVSCGGCRNEEEVELVATAKGWDDRGLDAAIEALGWKEIADGEHRCLDCLAEEGDE